MTNKPDTSTARLRELAYLLMEPELHAVFWALAAEKGAQAKQEPTEDLIEAAYWRFDARRKGYAQWKATPMSERDAFKAEMRNLYLAPQPSEPSTVDVPQSNKGHGHVRPRKDGYLARCGGPAICKVCQQEQAEFSKPAPADVLLPEAAESDRDLWEKMGCIADDEACLRMLASHREAYAQAKVAAELMLWRSHADAMAHALEVFEAQGSDKTKALRDYMDFKNSYKKGTT
jgi:hypothetical protein